MCLDFLGGGHHQVGHFVGHDHDVGQWCGMLPAALLRPPAGFGVHQLFFAQLVVDADVAHAGPSQQRVALFHLLDGPGQDRLGLAHVGHHRVHQVRQLLVGAQLDHLGVDHQHPHFVGPPGHQHRNDDRVQADALAGTGAAGDQQVRQVARSTTIGLPDTSLPRKIGIRILASFAVGLLHDLAEPHESAARCWAPRCPRCSCRESAPRSARSAPAGRSPGRRPAGDLAQPQPASNSTSNWAMTGPVWISTTFER